MYVITVRLKQNIIAKLAEWGTQKKLWSSKEAVVPANILTICNYCIRMESDEMGNVRSGMFLAAQTGTKRLPLQ